MMLYFWSKFIKKIKGSAIKHSKIDPSSKVESGSNIFNTRMGRYSFCGYNCEITNADIGNFCSIANGVVIGGGMHPMDWVSMSPVFYEGRDSVKAKFSEHAREPVKKTIIEHDVWIGQNALIKQGVKIGTGAIVGMGSIVTKNVTPYTIVAGNPATVIRKRFDDKIIAELLESKWWNFPPKKLLKYAKYFTNPEVFLKNI